VTKPKKKNKKTKKKGAVLSKMGTFNLNNSEIRALKKNKIAEKQQVKRESEQNIKEGIMMGQTVVGN